MHGMRMSKLCIDVLEPCEENNQFFLDKGYTYSSPLKVTMTKFVELTGLLNKIEILEDHYEFVVIDDCGRELVRKIVTD